MKKTVTVEITRTFEIEIPDEILGEEAVTKFSEYMFDIDSIDEIFEHVAYNITENNKGYELDYIGLLAEKGEKYNGREGDTVYKEIDYHAEFRVNQKSRKGD